MYIIKFCSPVKNKLEFLTSALIKFQFSIVCNSRTGVVFVRARKKGNTRTLSKWGLVFVLSFCDNAGVLPVKEEHTSTIV